jgi:hypothetical protein
LMPHGLKRWYGPWSGARAAAGSRISLPEITQADTLS